MRLLPKNLRYSITFTPGMNDGRFKMGMNRLKIIATRPNRSIKLRAFRTFLFWKALGDIFRETAIPKILPHQQLISYPANPPPTAITNSHTIDKPLLNATAPVRNRNVLSGTIPPTIVDAKVMTIKTRRYTQIPYCRNGPGLEMLGRGNIAAKIGNTAFNNHRTFDLKLIISRDLRLRGFSPEDSF